MGMRSREVHDGPSAAMWNRVAFCRGDRESNRTDFADFLESISSPITENERGGISQSNDVEFKALLKKKHTYIHTLVELIKYNSSFYSCIYPFLSILLAAWIISSAQFFHTHALFSSLSLSLSLPHVPILYIFLHFLFSSEERKKIIIYIYIYTYPYI